MQAFIGRARPIMNRVRRVSVGYSVRDKLRILGITILQLVTHAVAKPISSLDDKIGEITDKLWKGTVIKIYGIRWVLLDYESFMILAPYLDVGEVYAENFVQLWLKPRRGEVFLDIGAHIGKYALTVAKAVGHDGTVVAIEPHPTNYQALLWNIRVNKLENVVALNLAAWNTDCELKLFIGDAGGHHSTKINRGLGWVKAKAREMDDILEGLRLGRVDWIKIDVEGAECEVLLGLKETIKTYRPRIIIETLYKDLDILKKFMKKHGYGLIRISPIFYENIYFLCVSHACTSRINF